MKIVFISIYYTHHQAPFCEQLNKLTNGEFLFVSIGKMDSERKAMHWQENAAPFVVNYSDNPEKYQKEIDSADVVIYSVGPKNLIANRLKNNKLTFLCQEHMFKNGVPWYKWPYYLILQYCNWGRYKKLYLMCSSAYAYKDFALTGTFINKAYKWGYFPKTYHYDIDNLIDKKQEKNKVSILWVGRLLNWKHPEIPVLLAERLKKDGYSFNVNIIGNGQQQEQIQNLINQKSLTDCVTVFDFMPSENVREYMNNADIYLFTSDKGEGWGAVLNEAMNSGCAVIGCKSAGSTPYLINDGENGYVFKKGDMETLYLKLKMLMDNSLLRRRLGKKAYETISTLWNSDVAAKRFIEMSSILQKANKCEIFDNGPCSKA